MDLEKIRVQINLGIDELRREMGSLRTGRASSALVENIEVEAYGGAQRLRILELASVTVPDPQSIVISPWDKSIIGDIKKGILTANVGFNPSVDGEILRISIPPMTGEDRERFVKLLNTKIENAKVAVRQIRGDAMKDIKRREEENEISEDMRQMEEKQLQELVDASTDKIDELGGVKRTELLQV